MNLAPIRPTQSYCIPYAPPPCQAPRHHYTVLDAVNLTTAASATATGVAYLAGASDKLVGALALPALVGAPLAVAGMVLGMDWHAGATRDGVLARVASASLAAAGGLFLAGHPTAAGIAAMPALVAAPLAVAVAAFGHR